MRDAVLAFVQTLYRTSLAAAWARFARALARPASAQAERLGATLAEARGTAFGRAHGLARVRTLADYQSAVPIRDYDGLAPWIERAWAGEPAALTRSPLVAFEETSGSTRAAKHIPYTRPLLDDFAAATGPWLYDLYARLPALRRGTSYWSISPLGRARERSPGGVPVGLASDAEYLPWLLRVLRGVVLPVPDAVARLGDLDACRHATLRYLLADERLALISVWSPSFLALLIDHAARHADRLAGEVARGAPPLGQADAPPGLLPPPPEPSARRAAAIRAAFRDPARPDLGLLWPRLALVSAWADAEAARALPAVRAFLPRGVVVQPKGLIATEAVVSIPLLRQPAGAALAVGSHLIELLPSEDRDRGRGERASTILPHEAERGRRYLPVVTTRGGLYRYALGDEVEVRGFVAETPLVRFLGKVDGTSDLAGEKLGPALVREAIAGALAALGLAARFAMLAPDGGEHGEPPRYALWLELEPDGEGAGPPGAGVAGAGATAAVAIAAEVERRLAAVHHYAYARRLGQLGPVLAVEVARAAARYEAALVARGLRAGDIKPVSLHRGRFWREAFAPHAPGPARAEA